MQNFEDQADVFLFDFIFPAQQTDTKVLQTEHRPPVGRRGHDSLICQVFMLSVYGLLLLLSDDDKIMKRKAHFKLYILLKTNFNDKSL